MHPTPTIRIMLPMYIELVLTSIALTEKMINLQYRYSRPGQELVLYIINEAYNKKKHEEEYMSGECFRGPLLCVSLLVIPISVYLVEVSSNRRPSRH
jgi:hypothetical protein